MNRSMRWTAAILGLVALTAGLSACGDDDDESLDAYCEDTVEIETMPEPDIDFENSSPDEIAAAVKTYASDSLVPVAKRIQENAPEDIEDDIATLVAAVDEVAETGDFEAAFENAKTEAASKRVHEHDLDECGWERVDVVAKDYEFEGIPSELDTGVTSFEFTNEGKESHEFVLMRKNEGVTESFEEIIDLGEEEAGKKVAFLGGIGGDPGVEGEYLVNDLEPGEYLAICFIATGTTGEGHEGDGPPHFTKGMRHEFTVS